jgi:uncharacterized protein (TIGR02001 family)
MPEPRPMKKTLLALAALSALAATPAFAEDDASMFSFNVGAVSDYRYRGISQTRLKPALQGGVDVTLPAGFYVGTWASTIKWIKDAGGGANVEWDIYGGWKNEIVKDVTLDVGVLRYQYPSADLAISPNTTELYAAVSYGPATLKYSHSVTNLFGFDNSKQSGYLDLSATFDVGGGFSLAPHVGYQKVRHNGDFSYTDVSLALSKEIVKGLTGSLTLVATDTKDINGAKAYASPANGKNLGRAGVVAGIKYVF